MQDQLSLYNRALILMEGEAVEDVADQSSREARLISKIWEQDRDSLLREYQWNFATKRACDLTEYTVSVDCGFAYALQLPDDFLRLKIDINEECNPRHAIETAEVDDPANTGTAITVRALMTDDPSLAIRYVARVDLALWDPLAFEALAAKVATTCAMDYSGKSDRFSHAERHYERAISKAKRIDAMEGTKGRIRAPKYPTNRSGLRGSRSSEIFW